jgi:hypothetical protein
MIAPRLAAILLALLTAPAARAGLLPQFEDDLKAGKLGDAERKLDLHLKVSAQDDNARFALGVVRFLRAVEARAQGFYSHGYRTDPTNAFGITNLPIPTNLKPEPLDAKGMREMVDGWLSFLGEFQEILAGRKLAPFWRGDDVRLGVNVRRIFTQPRPFDLVLWVRGSTVAPYLERGEITRPEMWDRHQRVFRGEFIGFAIWFN